MDTTNSVTKYMVFNIGCIECGVSSKVVGVFTDITQASQLTKQLHHTHGWREGGQNAFQIFILPEDNVIANEYNEPPKEQQAYEWGDFEKDGGSDE